MTITDTVGRIQQIQSTLERLSNPAAARTAPTTGTASTTTATAASAGTGAPPPSFAEVLASAAGPAVAASTGSAGSASPAARASAVTASAVTAGATPEAIGNTEPITGPVPIGPEGVTGTSVVETAKKYIGVPYVWGGEDPTGMDCSGFVQWVFKDLGVEVPRVVGDQMHVGSEVNGMANARPGDLLVTLGGNHISFYLGNGKAIDAPQPGKNIAIRDLWETDANVDTIRRIVPAGDAASASAAALAPATAAAALASEQAAFLPGWKG